MGEMNQYTKGEWTIDYNNYINGGYSEWYEILANEEVIAKIGESRELTDEHKANAQLIAYAPLLYEALKELISRDDYGSIRLPTQARDIILQALAKAEGK